MSSLNSQESSNDICKLTDRQQAEYHNAYQEYIAQMAQMEGLGAGMERPAHFLPPGPDDKAKEGDLDARKAFPKCRSKVTDSADGDAQLDPITEEDEKPDPSTAARALLSRKAKGSRYHSVPSDEDESGAEGSENTPLLSQERKRQAADGRPPEHVHLLAEGGGFLSESPLDKKDSSDSGLRSSGSSSDHSLQDADSEPEKTEPEAALREAGPDEAAAVGRADLIELLEPPEGLVLRNRGLPRNLSELQESAVMRMSICSEAASEGSALASSPEENWPVTNLNRAASSGTLDNINSANNSQHALLHDTDSPPIIISPGSTTNSTAAMASSVSTTAVVHNENLRAIQLKRLPAGESRVEEEHESSL